VTPHLKPSFFANFSQLGSARFPSSPLMYFPT
jgi:hypothetical protein